MPQERTGRVEFYRDGQRHWRWRARAANGRIVADSAEGYVRQRDCRRGAAAAFLALMGRSVSAVVLLAALAFGLAGCAGSVRDMDVCRADWEQVQTAQVLCTADGRVEIVGRCFDPETGRYWLKVRSRW